MSSDQGSPPPHGAPDVGRPERPTGILEDRGVEFWMLLGVFRRRWLLVATCGLVAFAAALYVESKALPMYTAEVMVQRKVATSPLGAAAGAFNVRIPLEAIVSEIEIMRSPAVLIRVVESLGLRVQFPNRNFGRSELIENLEIDPSAPPGKYRIEGDASGIRLVDPDSEQVLAAADESGRLAGPGFQIQLNRSNIEVLPLTFSVLLHESAINDLAQALEVKQVSTTSLIRVRFSSADPEFSAAVVGALAEAYRGHSGDQAREEASRRREFLQNQLSQLADSVSLEQELLLQYQESSQTLNPEAEGQALATGLMEAENELRGFRFQENLLETLVIALRSGDTDSEAFYRIAALGDGLMPAGVTLYNRLRDLDAQRSRLTSSRFGLTEGASEVQQIDSLIASTQAEMRSIAEESLRLISARRAESEQRVEELQRDVGDVPGRATAYARLRQRVDAVQGVFDMVVEKYYEAQIAEAVESGDVAVVSPAMVPVLPDPSHKTRNLAAALFFGVLLGIGVSLLLEYANVSVRSVHEVEALTGLPVLARLPRLRSNSKKKVDRHVLDAGDLGAESFRILRTSLKFTDAGRPAVVLVTSTGPGDGKTTVVINLALTMAREGGSTLIVDADLHQPQVHGFLKVDRAPGLTDLLFGGVAVSDVIRKADALNLAVITSGSPSGVPSGVVGSEVFVKFLSWARSRFDNIVIDAPPVLVDSDAGIVGQAVDGAIVVVRAGQTSRSGLYDAVRRLRELGVPLVGTVLNDMERSDLAYYAYGNYSYRKEPSVDSAGAAGRPANGGSAPRPLGERLPGYFRGGSYREPPVKSEKG